MSKRLQPRLASDWGGEAIRRLEIEGCAVFNRVLDSDEIARLVDEFARLSLVTAPFNRRLSFYREVHYANCPSAHALIAHSRVLRFLRRLLGEEIVCMSSSYARYAPGYKGMPLHVDSQPYGSELFGPLASVPVSVRVFYYLDDLTEERAPLRVVPYSHLCLHAGANPYRRFPSHPEERAITCPAGSAVIIDQKLFHAAGANRTLTSRSVYTVSYRPFWAGPVRRVPAHDVCRMAALPTNVRRLFAPPNVRRADGRLPVVKDLDSAPLGANRWSDGENQETLK